MLTSFCTVDCEPNRFGRLDSWLHARPVHLHLGRVRWIVHIHPENHVAVLQYNKS